MNLAIVLLIVALASACDRPSTAPPIAPAPPLVPLNVVASSYAVADIARAVGGNHVKAQWLVESGQRLGSFSLSADDRAMVNHADYVLIGGRDEPWAAEGFDDPLRAERILRIDLLNRAATTAPTTGAATGPSTAASPDSLAGAAPSTLGYLWLDPDLARACANEFAARLAVRRARFESTFQQRSQAFDRSLDALLQEFAPRVKTSAPRKVMVLNDDFMPLLNYLKIETVRGDDRAGASAAAGEQTVDAVIVSADAPDAAANDLAARTHLRVIRLDGLGSSAPDSPRNGYLAMLRFDLEQLTGPPKP